MAEPNKLGEGGPISFEANTLFPNGGLGGTVNTRPFNRTSVGWLIIAHEQDFFFNGSEANLAEVICHEVGHALGLAHSTTLVPPTSETDSVLLAAMMFNIATGSDRGAVLDTHDQNVILLGYPLARPHSKSLSSGRFKVLRHGRTSLWLAGFGF